MDNKWWLFFCFLAIINHLLVRGDGVKNATVATIIATTATEQRAEEIEYRERSSNFSIADGAADNSGNFSSVNDRWTAKLIDEGERRNAPHHKFENKTDDRKWVSELFDAAKRNFEMTANVNVDCRKDYERYKMHLSNQSVWAIRMSEASEWPLVGIFAGNSVHMGHWRECVHTSAYGIKGQYCMTNVSYHFFAQPQLEFVEWPAQEFTVWDVINMYNVDPMRASRQHLMWAMCIPASCTHVDLKISLNETLEPIFRKHGFNITVDVDPIRCTTEKGKPLPKGYYIIWYAFLVVFTLSMVSSILDVRAKQSAQDGAMKQMLRAFSVVKNTKNLVSLSAPEHSILHVIKVVCMVLVVLAHRKLYSLSFPLFDTEQIEIEYKKEGTSFAHSALIDMFFMISGFITCHYGLVGVKNGGGVYLITSIILRWIRMIIPFGVVMLIIVYILPYINNGPYWNEYIYREVNNCKVSWWSSLLAVANIFQVEKQCLVVSWYVSVDIQLTIIASVLLFLLNKNRLIGLVAMVFTFISGMVVTFIVVFRHQFSAILPLYLSLLKDPRKSNDFNYHYIATYARVTSYLVGFVAAYIACRLKERKFVFSTLQLRLGPLLLLCCSEAYQFYGVVFYKYGRKYNAIEHALYAATYRWIFVAPVAYLLCISFTSGIDSIFEKIIRTKLFAALGRLCYSTYLLNTILLLVGGSSQADLMPSSTMLNLYWAMIGDIIYTYVVAYMFYLLVEAPVSNSLKILQNTILRKHESDAETINNNNNEPAENKKKEAFKSKMNNRKRSLVDIHSVLCADDDMEVCKNENPE